MMRPELLLLLLKMESQAGNWLLSLHPVQMKLLSLQAKNWLVDWTYSPLTAYMTTRTDERASPQATTPGRLPQPPLPPR